ncbi:hypothetical protein NITMOv2_2997 [Nitrospira moscoviensis]|uniref:DUF5666 domain-containing protein n=2 Tax=Nitrospira moscoviensis TaxID=42253 RepID=A0A0K2GFP2_NITMO|nr:hypothetical protein NITMOv2_2997 [Nitrospira moscoviensis]
MGLDSVFSMFRLTATAGLSLCLVGCGLDGMRGTVLAIEENRYVILDLSGQELLISVDEHSRRDGAIPGDEVRVFVTKDGYAAYIQKIEP